LTEAAEQTVYTIVLTKTIRGIYVYRIESVPILFNKLLHHWSFNVTYQTLNAAEIRSSIECADVLNRFDAEIEGRLIDELVTEAILLERPIFDDNIFNVYVKLCNYVFVIFLDKVRFCNVKMIQQMN